MVLVISAVFTGIAGGFYAIYLRVASPEALGFGTMSLTLSMELIGSVGTIFGPVAASLILIFATEAFAGIRGMEEARFVIIVVSMILVLRLAPGGVLALLNKLTRETLCR